VTILQTLQKTVCANAEVAAVRTGDELSRRFQEHVRSALPRSGDIAGRKLENYLGAVVAPVLGDLVRELRSADAKLTAQVEHLKRHVGLLDIRLRAPNENRSLKNRLFNLELEVSLLRRAAKK
jgi:hypothetical protein